MRHRLNAQFLVAQLECRINPGSVTTTMDFDPKTYLPSDPLTWKPGYLRYEVIKAFESGSGTATFDTSVDLDSGPGVVHCGDAISSANTIKLTFGQIGNILPQQSGSTVTFVLMPFTNVKILAPKYTDDTKDYVNVQWDNSIFPMSGDANSGADWSVVKLVSQEKSSDGRYPSYAGMTLGGLRLTNGRAGDGAGAFDMPLTKKHGA